MNLAFNNISNTQCLWCARGSTTSTKTFTTFYIGGSGYRHDYNSTLKQTSTKATVKTKTTVINKNNQLIVDGKVIDTQTIVDFTAPTAFQLLASHTSTVDKDLHNYATYNFYGCYIKQDNILIRQFIPCYNSSTDVAGLYDIIQHKFYESKNKAFTKGTQLTSSIYV